jgi:serine/threonine protein kinase
MPDAGMICRPIAHYRVLEKSAPVEWVWSTRPKNTRLRRNVALKFLPDEYSQNRAALERFRREARTASALNHPNICTIHDIGDHEGRPFIVMELLEGQTLRAVIGGKSLKMADLQEWAFRSPTLWTPPTPKALSIATSSRSTFFITERSS